LNSVHRMALPPADSEDVVPASGPPAVRARPKKANTCVACNG